MSQRHWNFRMGLRWQIALLGMCGVLLVGVIYFAGLRSQEALQRNADTATKLKMLVDDVAQGFLRIYQTDTEFLLRRDERLFAVHDALVEEMGIRLAAIDTITRSLPSGQPLGRATAIRPGLNNYVARFRNVAAAQRGVGLNENDGLEGRLRQAVHRIETRLSEFNELKLTNLMLMMRRHEKDFLLRGDEKYGAEIVKRGEEFSKELAASSIATAVKEEIQGLLSSYQQSFMALMVGRSSLKDESNDLSQIFASIGPLIAEVKTAAVNRFDEAQATISASRETTTAAMLWAIGVTILCSGALSVYVGMRTTKPLGALAAAMERAAAGDHGVDIPPLMRRDEIGAISRAFAVFQEGMRENARLSTEQQRALAENQRLAADNRAREEREIAEKSVAAQREDAARKTTMRKLANEFEAAIGGIIEAVSSTSMELESAAATLTKTADATRQLATTLTAASEEASTNVQTVASASEGLGSSVTEVGTQVQAASRIASEAVRQAESTDVRVRELSSSAIRIGNVVKLISAVAEQTNLLALNATIEAARAGDAGKGFAVVAQEVKALAGQTAKATEEISAQVIGMQQATDASVAAITEIADTIGRIAQISSIIAAAVEEQTTATQQISRNVGEAAQGTARVAVNITEMNRGASETGAASTRVLLSANSLAHESSRLKLEAQKFLDSITAS